MACRPMPMIAVSGAQNSVLSRVIDAAYRSHERDECSPGQFRLQAVTLTGVWACLFRARPRSRPGARCGARCARDSGPVTLMLREDVLCPSPCCARSVADNVVWGRWIADLSG